MPDNLKQECSLWMEESAQPVLLCSYSFKLMVILLVLHVKWFRDHADPDHFKEELEILEAKHDQHLVWHNHTGKLWFLVKLCHYMSQDGLLMDISKQQCRRS